MNNVIKQKGLLNRNSIGLLNKRAKALGHPARIEILEYLLAHQTCICGDLVDELPLAQATVSQHLKELKAAGLIHGEIEGNSVCYCINGLQLPIRAKSQIACLSMPCLTINRENTAIIHPF